MQHNDNLVKRIIKQSLSDQQNTLLNPFEDDIDDILDSLETIDGTIFTYKCTWKENLPTMEHNNYKILYGIAPSISNITVIQIKQMYNENAIQLFTNSNYVNQQGQALQNKANINDKEFSLSRDYIGIAVQKCKVLDTSLIANTIQEQFNKHAIKNKNDEKLFITNYCRNNGFGIFSFPAQYKEINASLYTKKIIRPACYYIANTNIIVDVAIGIDNIQRMITKYTTKK